MTDGARTGRRPAGRRRPWRHHRGGGHPGDHDRRHPGRPGRPPPVAGDHHRRSEHQHDRSGSTPPRWPGRAAAGDVTGTKLTARLIKNRLDAELVGNVSIRVLPTERPDTWEVQGRGELALAVLVELMRREGFELTVGKPQVLTREINGKRYEPMERVSVDVPEDFMGVVTQLLSLRKGRMETLDESRPYRLVPHGVAGPGPRTDRLSDRVPHRDPRHRAAAPRLRGVRAVARRAAHPAERRRWWPTAAAPPRPTP